MNAPDLAADVAPVLFDPRTKARMAIASRIAAGMAANSGTWKGPDPRGTIAWESWAIAGRLMTLAETGGC